MTQWTGSPLEVLIAFTRLGLTSFGGPIAHIGYFRREFVERRGWLDSNRFADLLSLCQFLPGPASSQLGFAIGLHRAGYAGALAAWCGFTLPSAAVMLLMALGFQRITGGAAQGAIHGLKLVAVAIVAQALWGMARSLCPDPPRAAIGAAALAVMLWGGDSAWQFAALIGGGLIGWRFCRTKAASPPEEPVGRLRESLFWLALFVTLLVGLPVALHLLPSPLIALFDRFYRAGALVFGGGHVVLPLLYEGLSGQVTRDQFLAGYGAAQAIPGPLFTVACYFGGLVAGVPGAMVGLIGIFLPGFLLLLAALPLWHRIKGRAAIQAIMRGVNAAVVGLLAAAFYDPVWTGSIHRLSDIAFAAVGFLLLIRWRVPPLLLVLLGAAYGLAFA